MKIKTVYLAGGINGLSDADANNWRNEAKRLLPREIGVLDPMSRDYRGKEDENVGAIVEGDLADIQGCEAVIAYCPRPSWGTAMEIQWTATTGRNVTVKHGGNDYEPGTTSTLGHRWIIAIVPTDVAVSPWLRHHVDAVVPTLEEAVEQLLTWSE